jgi:hypothetical protein
MGRWRARRALQGATALACCAFLGSIAVGLAASKTGTGPLLTQEQAAGVERDIRDAMALEEKVRLEIQKNVAAKDESVSRVRRSVVELDGAKQPLKENRLDTSDTMLDLRSAVSNDLFAIHNLKENKQDEAASYLDRALREKAAAIDALSLITVSSNGPTLTGQLFPITDPGAVDLAINSSTPISGLLLAEESGAPIAPKRGPRGWSCGRSATHFLFCQGPPQSTFTVEIKDESKAPSISAYGWRNHRFGHRSHLKPSPFPPITVSPDGATLTGQLSTGTEPDTLILAINGSSPIDALLLEEESGWPIAPRGGPSGWLCARSGTPFLLCHGPPTSAFTLDIEDRSTAPSILAYGSRDQGHTFGRSSLLRRPPPTTPTPPPTPIMVTVTCPSSVTAGQSARVDITLSRPDLPITDVWMLPNGLSPVTHIAMVDSTGTKGFDEIGAPSFATGLWNLRVTTPGGGLGTCAFRVNPP